MTKGGQSTSWSCCMKWLVPGLFFLSLSFWKSLNPFTHTATAMRLKTLNITMLVGTTSITVENRNSQGYMWWKLKMMHAHFWAPFWPLQSRQIQLFISRQNYASAFFWQEGKWLISSMQLLQRMMQMSPPAPQQAHWCSHQSHMGQNPRNRPCNQRNIPISLVRSPKNYSEFC